MWKGKRKEENRNSYEDITNLMMEMADMRRRGEEEKTKMERKDNQVDDQ